MIVTSPLDQKLGSALEYSEVAYWSKFYDSRSELKCYGNVVAGAFAGAVPELDVLALNRVIGLGAELPVRPADIDCLIDFYRKSGTKRFMVQLTPLSPQEELSDLLEQKGFRHHNNWAKLLRQAGDPLPEAGSSLRVVAIGPEQAQTYGQIIFDCFDWPDERLVGWLAASVGKPAYHHYLVMHGEQAIAAGALHLMNYYASMAFAATLPEYRGLGAQSMLLSTRIRHARALGAEYIIAETAEEKPGQPVTSYRNMRRLGFEVAYLRQNWLFEL